MDDLTPYRDDFDKALQTLEKVLERCIATRLCLSHEKCHMMMTEGLILGHYISIARIQVDPTKIQQRAKWHDALIKKKTFHEGDWVLPYDSRFQYFLGKLQTRWLGPYEIKKVHDNGTLTLATFDGYGSSVKANGHRVCLYQKPLTRESFYQQIREDPTMQVLAEESNPSVAS
eukprot:PITA_22393